MSSILKKINKKMSSWLFLYVILPVLFLLPFSCKKLVEIPPPTYTVTTSQVFADSANVASVMDGLYTRMVNNGNNVPTFAGYITLYEGTAADELLIYGNVEGSQANDLMYNHLSAYQDGALINGNFWSSIYTFIYQANSIIEGVSSSKGLNASGKAQFTGEALFFRAFFHFYLTNLYGSVPIITTTDYITNEKAVRSPAALVYKQIITDLLSAQSLLAGDYSAGGGQRIRVNKWAATALLARAYLYTGDYKDAEIQAGSIINNTSLYSLSPLTGSTEVFSANSSEAILQWNLNTSESPYNATAEGRTLIPTRNPTFYINQQLLNAFEPGDQRRTDWVDSITYFGVVYHYPYKYKVGTLQATINTPAPQYYMVLRLAEQYLIRAEAEAHGFGQGLSGAISDVNIIRNRAGLPPTTASITSQALAAIMQERRIELFAEGGNRWFDLKRTGTIDSVMTIATRLKGGGTTWQSYQQLYPISLGQLQVSPYLIQTPGY